MTSIVSFPNEAIRWIDSEIFRKSGISTYSNCMAYRQIPYRGLQVPCQQKRSCNSTLTN